MAADSFHAFADSVEEKDALYQEAKKIVEAFGKTDEALCEQICRARAFNFYDYMLFQGMAHLSGNKVYALTINGMRKIYGRVGGYYFLDSRARDAAMKFYHNLLQLTNDKQHQQASDLVKQYGRESGVLWFTHRDQITQLMEQEEA